MPLPTIYNTGTASIANGATTLTIVGAVSNAIYAGDLFMDPAQPLVPPQRIASVTGGGVYELAVGWPGTALVAAPYVVHITPDSARMSERTRRVLEALDQRGLPQGGDAGQVLGKVSGDDYDVDWVDDAGAATAADVEFTPAGSIAAVTVQTAIEELDTEKQAASANLTALAAAFTPASGTTAAGLALAEDTDNGTNTVTVKAPAAVTANRTFTMPDADVAVSVFGASLLDDADAAAGRATLGLGTVAVEAVGTSGAVVPRLNGNNSYSGTASFTGSAFVVDQTATFAGPIFRNTNDTASLGPNFNIDRLSASPAANDNLGQVSFRGRDSAGNDTMYGELSATLLDPTDGSEDGQFNVKANVAGASTTVAAFANGVLVGSATGGFKGTGTLNATAVYDDNTLLTCMALQAEFLERGEINLAKWDALIPDVVIPAHEEHRVVTEPVERLADIVAKDGTMVRKIVVENVPVLEMVGIWDEEGNGLDAAMVPIVETVTIPEQVISRTHGTARLFADMLAEGFDPRDPAQYIARLKADQALPGMPTRSTWEHNALSSGEMFNRLWLATEMLAIVVMNLHGRLASAGL